MTPDALQIDRFARDLDALLSRGTGFGLAVSGGPDSLALLLLAVAARPGEVSVATVDHGLRPESRDEADQVAQLCARLGVPHHVLTAAWSRRPTTAVQEKARLERYRLLGEWAADHKLDAVATGHHRDDQAETVAMRLARGSGVRGLAGMRKAALIPGCDIRLLRPLLDWSHAELAQICVDAGVEAVDDPSNSDDSYERVRVRRALADGVLIDPAKVAASAAALGEAEDAIAWTVERVWAECAVIDGSRIALQSAQLPPEIERRLIARAIASLASEGEGVLRGKEVDMVLERLREGGQATLRGVLCTGGADWQFVAAPHRTRRTTINR